MDAKRKESMSIMKKMRDRDGNRNSIRSCLLVAA